MYFIRSKFFIYLLASILWITSVSYAHSQNNQATIDSLTSILNETQGVDRFNSLFDLFRLNLPDNLEDAQHYALEALEVATSLHDTLAIVKSNNAIGYVKKELGYPKNAIPYFQTALNLARSKNYTNQVKYILNNLGLANARSANYAKALENHLESLKIREEEKDTVSISIALNNIGVLYQDLEDYENAFTYYRRSYELKQKTKDYTDFELCLINLADVSNALSKYNEAKIYLREFFDRCSNTAVCDKRQLALAHNALGYSFLNTSDLVHAEQEFFVAANLHSELKSPERIDSYHALALVRYKMGDYSGALDKLNIAQTLAEETEIPKYLLQNYQLYGDIYTQQKDFRKASEYQKKFIALNDEIYNADLIKNIARVQSEHQEEENLRTIAAQDQEILSREESLSLQRKQFFFLGIIAALVFILSIVFYRNQKKQTKTNLELEKAKETLERAKQTIEEKNKELIVNNTELDNRVKKRTKELHSSNESLRKVNEELDNFIYKTSHDIRGPLTSLKGLTNLAIREASEDVVLEYLNKLDLTADKLNKILTRLQIINQINHAMLGPELIDFQTMIDDILSVERKRGMPKKLNIQTNIADDIILFSDKMILKIVLENLVDNAIKFCNSSDRNNPFVSITIVGHDSGVTIKVLDNGIGIKNIAADQIFKMFVRASERSETGGIGLYLAKISTEKLGGSIELKITEGDYTEFVVNLPSDLRAVLKQREEIEIKMQLERMKLAQMQMDESKQNSGLPA